MKRRTLPAALGIIISTACGCVTFSARPLAPSWSASSQIQQQETSGLSVAVRSLGDELREEDLVGRPAKKLGFYPFVLLFENHGQQPFLLRREGIRLETANGGTHPAATTMEVYEELRWSRGLSALGLPFAIFPALLIDSRISQGNRDFLDDLRAKAFRDIRLYQNPREYNCVVFFRMEPEEALSLKAGDCWVSVEVERQATDELPGKVILFRLVPQS